MQKNTFILMLIFLLLSQFSFSQKADSTKAFVHFGGAVTVTSKGISLIPTFTLGKPAVIFDMNVGKKKLSFEPQLRFALEGKPWSFIFWWRYKLLTTNKLKIGIGAHPSLVFKTVTASVNGVSKDFIAANRYLATELSPNYSVSKNVSVGLYYLYSHGIDKDAVRNTHFLTINGNFSNIKLGNRFFARFVPQFYYLYQDGKDGFYFTSMLTLGKKSFPLTIQSIINKFIQTNITASKSFVWNVSLIYSFNNTYVRHQ